MAEFPPRRRPRKNNNTPLIVLIFVMLAALIALVALAANLGPAPTEHPLQTTEQTEASHTHTMISNGSRAPLAALTAATVVGIS